MPYRQGLYKRWVAGGAGNCALWVKLAKMFNVPGVAHWNGIFGLQLDCARPGDSCYPIRAFPLWRQLVGILGRLNAPKNKVAFLKASGMNLAAIVVACYVLSLHWFSLKRKGCCSNSSVSISLSF